MPYLYTTLLITNKNHINRSHAVLYEEAYRKISGSDTSIPILCVDLNTEIKAKAVQFLRTN